MSYEILTDDLYEDDDNKSRKSNKKNSSDKKFNLNINPLYIHIILILIIFGIVFYYFMPNFSLNSELNETKKITLVGELSDFDKNYHGDLDLYSSEFLLKTNNGEFNSESMDFKIKGFNGSIRLVNNSIFLNGTALKIDFGKNSLKLDNNSFMLKSNLKTNIKLYFNGLDLRFSEGRIVFGDILNYEFKNTSVHLINYNCSINYDGIFSFDGIADSFNLDSIDEKLQIQYN